MHVQAQVNNQAQVFMFRHRCAYSGTGMHVQTWECMFRHRYTVRHRCACSETDYRTSLFVRGDYCGMSGLSHAGLISLYGENDRKWTEIYGAGIGPGLDVRCPLAKNGCHMTFSGNVSYSTMT